MQRLLAAALVSFLTLAPVGALSTEIIGVNDKEPIEKDTEVTDASVAATAVAQKKPIDFEEPENVTATDVAKHINKVIDKETVNATGKEAKAINKAQKMIKQEANKIKEAKEDAKESARVAKQMAEEARKAQELKEAEEVKEVPEVTADAASIDAVKTMDEAGGASEQGFSGPNVQHNDMKTATGDWQAEYGRAQTGLRSHAKICDLYPDNEWCQKNVKKAKSAAAMPASTLAALIALCSGLAGLL